ncbi:hypothetical protein LTR86_009936 [Recurvomyces mirabilis]|nr:hypothetical protein LTR86_009936 [Recurvomyces mirabilis]
MSNILDADASQIPNSDVARRWDDLPAFTTLTTDEDRERKAETQKPGTFSVITTPESFSSLPEYAATSLRASGRRESAQSLQESVTSSTSSGGRSGTSHDLNTVVLDRFEDATSPSGGAYSLATSPRLPNMPDALQRLSISTSTPVSMLPTAVNQLMTLPAGDAHLIAHFRQNITPRLLQPTTDDNNMQDLVPGSTRDLFQIESARFTPLHHAMCAISALNLSYTGRISLEEALQHYEHALSATVTPTTADHMLSDGVFLRHLLLFIYDICVPMASDHDGHVMWATHLSHLRTIAVQRHQRFGREPHGYLLWLICELDMNACLLGSGNCEFVRTMLQNDMLPTLDQQIPASLIGSPYSQNEARILPAIQRLNEGVVLNTIKLAQLAQACRSEAAAVAVPSPGANARWQAAVSRLQGELVNFWTASYPEFLGPDTWEAGRALPPRPRYVFEHAFLLYQASIIYSRTSMFPSQRTIPLANQADVYTDTERRCYSILALASEYVSASQQRSDSNTTSYRHMVLPIFMAGIATTQADGKNQAIHIIKAMESPAKGSIGQNTLRTRQLLLAVCEEQGRVVNTGGRMEQVDWFAISRERGLNIVNCGL